MPTTETVRPRVEVLEHREVPATFTVDATVAAVGKTTLADAITAANDAAGADQIAFDIPVTDAGYDAARGVFVIDSKAGAVLPTITDKLSIDGYTQPVGGQGIRVEIRGENEAGVRGLAINATGCVVRGLAVYGAETGIVILDDQNSVQDCIIGTRAGGTEAGFGNKVGIDVSGNANWIVACTVSGNQEVGVRITRSNNTVQECVVGLTSSGTAALPNGTAPVGADGNPQAGILIATGTVVGVQNNSIVGNTISGNGAVGVALNGGDVPDSVRFNVIANNYIGLSVDGKSVLANATDGILITSTATDNVIGHYKIGETYADGRNVIVGNSAISGSGYGIRLASPESDRNAILGNYVGVLPDGVTKAGNFGSLVVVAGDENTIGGVNDAARDGGGTISLGNVISGGSGLLVSGSKNVIQSNYVGTDATGTQKVGGSGIAISGNNNLVGGRLGVEGNVVSGNSGFGIRIRGAGQGVPPEEEEAESVAAAADAVDATAVAVGGASGNEVYGNIVGLDKEGKAALGNGGNGIEVNTASGTIIGKADDGMTKYRNIISANGNPDLGITPSENNGVYVTNSSTTTIANNYIGLKLDGTAAADIGNLRGGVYVDLACTDTTIGGGDATTQNVISKNGNYAVNIRSAGGTNGTKVTGNIIGRLTDGTTLALNGGAANDAVMDDQDKLWGIWIDSDQINATVVGGVTTYAGVDISNITGQYKVAWNSAG